MRDERRRHSSDSQHTKSGQVMERCSRKGVQPLLFWCVTIDMR